MSKNCTCGLPCSTATAKTGQNAGRQFYGCANFRTKGCGFFEWAPQGSMEDRQPTSNDELREAIRLLNLRVERLEGWTHYVAPK